MSEIEIMKECMTAYMKDHPDEDIGPTLAMLNAEGALIETVVVGDVYMAGKVARELLDSSVCETVIFVSEGYELNHSTMERTGREVLIITKMTKDLKMENALYIVLNKKTGQLERFDTDEAGRVEGKLADGFLNDYDSEFGENLENTYT